MRRERAMALFEEGYNWCAVGISGVFGFTWNGHAHGGGTQLVFRRRNGKTAARCAERSAGCFLRRAYYTAMTDPGAREEKAAHYARIQELAKAFEEKNGSIVCRELLGLSVKREEPTPKERTAEYYKKAPLQGTCRGCPLRYWKSILQNIRWMRG